MRLFYLLLFVLCTLLTLASAGRDFYAILGVPRNADDKQIKKAYRKLSMKYHPDTNGGSKEAEAKFQEVAQAYEVLIDKDKRRVFDRSGEEGLHQHLQQQQHGGGNGGMDPFDLFSSFFNPGGRRPAHREQQRGQDVIISLPVTLEDLFNGATFEVSVHQQVLCSHCRGTGAETEDDLQVCGQCQGQGMIIQRQMIGPGMMSQRQVPCPHCNGKGRTIRNTCHKCHGHKLEAGHRNLDIFVDEGMADGQKIEFQNAADEHHDMNAGHVIFVIKQLPHQFYTRDGDDLKCTIAISLKESLVGFTRHLTQLNGEKVLIQRTSITQPNSVIKFKNKGMPSANGERGLLHVTIKVVLPKQLTKAQQDVLQGLF